MSSINVEGILDINEELFHQMLQTTGTSDWIIGIVSAQSDDVLIPSLIRELFRSEPLLKAFYKDVGRIVTGTMLFGEKSLLSSYIFIELAKNSNAWSMLDWYRGESGIYRLLVYPSDEGAKPVKLHQADWLSLCQWLPSLGEDETLFDEEISYTIGESVRCLEGAFEGYEGYVIDLRGRNVVVVFSSDLTETPPVSIPSNKLVAESSLAGVYM